MMYMNFRIQKSRNIGNGYFNCFPHHLRSMDIFGFRKLIFYLFTDFLLYLKDEYFGIDIDIYLGTKVC